MVTLPVYSAPLDAVTTAVLQLFRGDATEHGQRWVYDGAYAGDPVKPPYPYSILYRIAGGSSDPFPDLADNPLAVTVAYQLTTVAAHRNQCERAAAAARDRFLARTRAGHVHALVLPDGWTDTARRPDPAMPGIDLAGDHPNAIHSQPQRFYLTVAPHHP